MAGCSESCGAMDDGLGFSFHGHARFGCSLASDCTALPRQEDDQEKGLRPPHFYFPLGPTTWEGNVYNEN